MGGPSHSASLLALLLLCALVHRTNPSPLRCLSTTNEFHSELQPLEEEVKNCPDNCTSTDETCQCLNLTNSVPTCSLGYFNDGLLKMMKMKISSSFRLAASELLERVGRWCLKDYSSVSPCEATISPKLFLAKLRTLYEVSNSR